MMTHGHPLQGPTEAQRAARRASDAAKAAEWPAKLAWWQCQHRNFSDRTVEALLKDGVDAPERLLFMCPDQLRTIPGVGKVSLAEIMAYRARFLP